MKTSSIGRCTEYFHISSDISIQTFSCSFHYHFHGTQLPREVGCLAHRAHGKNDGDEKTHHKEYHHVANAWNVKRTPLHHYPESARDVILNRRSNELHRMKHGAENKLGELDLLLKVLHFEARNGCRNVRGRSGQYFADFLQSKLQSLSQDFASCGRRDLGQRCKLLADRVRRNYTMRGIRNEDRLLIVNTIIKAVSNIRDQIDSSSRTHNEYQEHDKSLIKEKLKKDTQTLVKNSQAVLYSCPDKGTDDDSDALSSQAHEEETKLDKLYLRNSDASDGSKEHAPLQSGTNENDNFVLDEYVQVGGRRIKRQTFEFRQSFKEAAQRQAGEIFQNNLLDGVHGKGEQRTDAWMKLRERRLTASAFLKALGFFSGDRNGLWEEKVGLREPFAGNAATAWGVRNEPLALKRYCELTGQNVEPCMFKMKHSDPPHAWIGASPDGLLPALTLRQGRSVADGDAGLLHWKSEIGAMDKQIEKNEHNIKANSIDTSMFHGEKNIPTGIGPGILEIKCPFNKGYPDEAVPPKKAIWYYMPQLQGLMDIFDREWCHLYVWTPRHGSVIFLILRDRQYWAACFDVLADFWWEKVVPARQEKERGAASGDTVLEKYRPVDLHPSSLKLRDWSKELAARAPAFACE